MCGVSFTRHLINITRISFKNCVIFCEQLEEARTTTVNVREFANLTTVNGPSQSRTLDSTGLAGTVSCGTIFCETFIEQGLEMFNRSLF